MAQSLSEADTSDTLIKLQLSTIKQVCDEKAALIDAANIYQQGKLLYEKGKLEDAINHFRQAIKEYPTNIELKLNLVLTIQKLIEADTDNMDMLAEADELLTGLSDLSESHSVYDSYEAISRDIDKLRFAA
ncbi:MAG: tetratricopeptide repeat protein [Pseudomonadota bacterium]|nr:tetratricopeptide repeat protein [Pseudomonadota bacterium]